VTCPYTKTFIGLQYFPYLTTIYHGFVRAAYKFFGVNGKFLDMMDTLGTGRLSRIIFDDNSLSRAFRLDTGRPQGDCLSPLQFNAGDQILLLKIELDPELESVYGNAQVPRNMFPVNTDNISINFRNECNAETDKADCLADDTTVCMLLKISCLRKLKNILENFSIISGLKCNFEKTCVLTLNAGVGDLDMVTELGYRPVQNLTLLGFKLDINGPMTDLIFQELYQKICRLITVWDRYRLSLPGRIGIFKTLLLSQLSFHGSILRPSNEMLSQIQNVMDNFVLGSTKVAKDRLYLEPKQGGLGLINLDTYLVGLHVAWVKKAATMCIDNWGVDMRTLTCGNPYILGSSLHGIQLYPGLKTLADDFERFAYVFSKSDSNYKKSFIVNNKLFARQDRRMLTTATFQQNNPFLDMEKY
jgi:hypothetical protein